jgi:adenine-specific DNA-methyltransferase
MSTKDIKPEKMDLKSMDVSAENKAKLKALFPSVFTETRNENGELVESIDFEKLKAELGTFNDVFEARRERYGMDWPGKKDCMKLIQQSSVGTLKSCRDESVNFDTTENLFIEGDNLEVLKLLQKSYYGKVKMIYTDPPYNTGNEFIYPDDYTESLDTYLAYAGLVDDEGKKFSTNTPNEGRFHTRWLNMMYPRLYLARNLLREDGAIFISIDDNEAANLRKLCDEIFGEENFIAVFVWKARASEDSRSNNGVSQDHEYIISYAKSDKTCLRGTQKDISKFSNPDNDLRGPWRSADLTGLATAGQRPNLHYDLIDPISGVNYGCPPKGWRYDKTTMSRKIAEGRILWPSSVNGRPRHKLFLNEMESSYKNTSTLLNSKSTSSGTRTVRDLFEGNVFDFPKPNDVIRFFVEQSTAEGGIILDFFAGSCTTAHAVLDLNKEEDGNRKFIMVQLPEPCDENSEAYKAGYKTIADIGKERIRRVIKKIEEEQAAKATGEPQQELFESEEEQSQLDLGFKVFKLDRSNFKIWAGSNTDASEEEIARQLELFIDHIDPSASQENILYELLLKAGFMLTEKVEKREMGGKTVFSISDGALLICLEEEITRELIDAVAAAEPMQFICLDRGFRGNDQLKANAVQTFAARNQGRDKTAQIVFRTV